MKSPPHYGTKLTVLVSKLTVKHFFLRREEAGMDWNLAGMLHSMSMTAQGVVVMLLLMSAISIGLAVERGLRYSVAQNQ